MTTSSRPARDRRRFLFFLVHPAKFHFHKHQINELRARGHEVEVVITTKDVLEDLVREEGWTYTNIFPEGRKVPGLHVYLGALVSLFRTIWRLLKYTRGRRFDLFVGDALTFVGRLTGTPSIYATDDVFRQVPEQSIFLVTCSHIVAPAITALGPFNRRVVRYDGYKALAHLHPRRFTPDRGRIEQIVGAGPYVLIRCVGFAATHDVAHKGIDDAVLGKLVALLQPKYRVLISSERALPEDLEPLRFRAARQDIAHLLAFADLVIADSTTMCAEAAVLGTPSFEFDDYFDEIEQMKELESRYGLTFGIPPDDPDRLLAQVSGWVTAGNSRDEFLRRRDRLLSEKIDVSGFLLWLFEAYPESARQALHETSCQDRFR